MYAAGVAYIHTVNCEDHALRDIVYAKTIIITSHIGQYLRTLAQDLLLEGLHPLHQKRMVEWDREEMGDMFTKPIVLHNHLQTALGICY